MVSIINLHPYTAEMAIESIPNSGGEAPSLDYLTEAKLAMGVYVKPSVFNILMVRRCRLTQSSG